MKSFAIWILICISIGFIIGPVAGIMLFVMSIILAEFIYRDSKKKDLAEKIDEAKAEQKVDNTVELKVEQVMHRDVLYFLAYKLPENKFFCQGNTAMELSERIVERFSHKKIKVVGKDDRLVISFMD